MPDENRCARGLEVMEEVQGRERAAAILEGLGAMHSDLPRHVPRKGWELRSAFTMTQARAGADT